MEIEQEEDGRWILADRLEHGEARIGCRPCAWMRWIILEPISYIDLQRGHQPKIYGGNQCVVNCVQARIFNITALVYPICEYRRTPHKELRPQAASLTYPSLLRYARDVKV